MLLETNDMMINYLCHNSMDDESSCEESYYDDIIITSAEIKRTNISENINSIYILPITSVLSTLVVNSFFWVLLGVLLIYLGIEMQISKILFVNYVLAEFIFILAIVYFLSALSVFIKDVKDITAVLTNLLFWSTPIVWDEAVIPDKYRFILDYNPMYYFVKGTRDTLIYNDMRFAHELSQHAIFYGVFIILLFLSFRFYFVMKDEFAQNL